MANQVTRTYVASIRNHQQVRADLDSLRFAASKLWNVARWTCNRIWSETGTIPDDSMLKTYLKSHERYADLNAQSSQAILEGLAEAFESWYAHRENGNESANPPATASAATSIHAQRSRSRRTTSSTTPTTTGFGSQRDRTSRNRGLISSV